MKVAELGEFGLINRLRQTATAIPDSPAQKKLVLGIGDDAAAWRGDTSIQLATVDSMVQDVHFSPSWASWTDIGAKAIASNLSDIAAMGGLPLYALVAMTLPGDMETEDVVALYCGMRRQAAPYGLAIVGGNISRAPLVSITITIIGHSGSPKRAILTRSSARPGDVIAVTGSLGAAAAGLAMLRQNKSLPPQVQAVLRQAILTPLPRIPEGRLLVDLGIRTAIDISDGLLADLSRICQASQVGARLRIAAIPIRDEVRTAFGEQAVALALQGGEDYELLFSGPRALVEKAQLESSCPITIIGDITAENTGVITLVDEQGRVSTPRQKGWDHFASS
jgi:thiamine-monophosphate kinase